MPTSSKYTRDTYVTLRTSELLTKLEHVTFSEIEYTYVSHTWGRFRKPGPGAKVQNCRWAVPHNNQFDVESLPEILYSVWKAGKLTTRYLWLDLLCIPQSDTFDRDIELAQVADDEIDRQARIFRNATSCVCWLHDDAISSWKATQKTIRWCAVDWLRKTTIKGLYNLEDLLGLLAAEAETPTELSLSSTPDKTWFHLCGRPKKLVYGLP
ncbi:hypothetical protein BP5796_10822 [Coleophoma crateriformis]|uniref:Heterokaryon incompatibility domain-containing protein n=1 Tax=Coleophoma crateriformis TaxID=565419 RepID=A0A3D8QLI6_9HELO|nr:hypothetical protein BP5796_10822 [Coleophoma crateriformis]